MIWHKEYSLEELQPIICNMVSHLDIQLTEIGDDYLCGSMPVDQRTTQPMGLLHGGASCVLAESLASYASNLCVDPQKYSAVGLEINANHIRSVTKGKVHGVCKPLHLGKTTHVWDIRINGDHGKLVCVSRMTIVVLNQPSKLI